MNDMSLNSDGRNQNDDAKNSSDAKPTDKPRRKGMPRLDIPQSFFLGGQPEHDAARAAYDEQVLLLAARLRRGILAVEGVSYAGIESDSRGMPRLSLQAERTDGDPKPLCLMMPLFDDDAYDRMFNGC